MLLLTKEDVKALIKRKGFTITEVAEKMGVSAAAFHQRLNSWNERKQVELFKILGMATNISNIAEPTINYTSDNLEILKNKIDIMSKELQSVKARTSSLLLLVPPITKRKSSLILHGPVILKIGRSKKAGTGQLIFRNRRQFA